LPLTKKLLLFYLVVLSPNWFILVQLIHFTHQVAIDESTISKSMAQVSGKSSRSSDKYPSFSSLPSVATDTTGPSSSTPATPDASLMVQLL
jgi:hypothetical protein